MAEIDPIKAAEELAQQHVKSRVDFVRELVTARQVEDAAAAAVTASKNAETQSPHNLQDVAQRARSAAEELLKDATQHVAQARKAATSSGGWSTDELHKLGLVKSSKRNKRRPIQSSGNATQTEQTMASAPQSSTGTGE